MTTVRPPSPYPMARPAWGGGRIALIIIGSVIGLFALVATVGGGVAAWADGSRDRDGFLTSTPGELSTDSYGLRLPSIVVDGAGLGAAYAQDSLGTLRITAASTERPVFVGVGPADRVAAYLRTVRHDDLEDVHTSPFRVSYSPQPGGAPDGLPAAQDFWVAASSGTATQVLTWEVLTGDWSIVMMNADGSAHVTAAVSVGATIPVIHRLSVTLLIVGPIVLLIALGMILGAVISYRRQVGGRTPTVW